MRAMAKRRRNNAQIDGDGASFQQPTSKGSIGGEDGSLFSSYTGANPTRFDIIDVAVIIANGPEDTQTTLHIKLENLILYDTWVFLC